METTDTKLDLSPSEKRTLQYVAEGEFHPSELDWVALQRLKTLGLAEQRANGIVLLTAAGRRELQRLLSRK
jgi:hypothetical protein